ncbi:B-cell receptor CD22-like [Colossoma macropomum]|uniref:B-cell receptor CD22-like n=1 Tax=Colossoma macropomum TaxID=42526 RepID=UPI001863D808|nr:B-cell receptor CD22-like [Colossoma macropomum]
MVKSRAVPRALQASSTARLDPPSFKAPGSLTDPTFIWYKNGRPLTTKTIKNNQLHLQTVSSEDAGSYSCAVRGYQHLHSTAHNLRVRYHTKSVSVSIHPSGEIVQGSSVTLTCSSDANPPVECQWFKETSLLVKEKNYTITNASSVDSGEYKCKCINEHGERYSEALTLDVLYPTKSVSVSISPSGEILEGSSVTLTCSSDANPPAQNYTWFKESGTSPVGSGQNYSIFNITADHKGWYHCEAWNKLGSPKASAALFLHPGRSYTTVFVIVGLACIGTVITVCFVYLMIRWAKRTVQNVSPAVDVYTAPDCGSICCDEVQTPPIVVLYRPHDDNNTVLNTYATTEEAYVALSDADSSFHEAYQALDDTYLVPEYLEELYANVSPAVDVYTAPDCGSICCDEVQTPPIVVLYRPHDDNSTVLNTYATTEEAYVALSDADSSFHEAYQALDDTYLVPEYLEEFG